MINSSNDDLFGVIEELRVLFPDWRLGQLVASLSQATGRAGEEAIWEVEDEELIAVGRRLIERNQSRLTMVEPLAAVGVSAN